MNGNRIGRSIAIGAAAQILIMYLANAGNLPESLRWLFAPTLLVASVLGIGAHDGGIIVIAFMTGTILFGAAALALDVLFVRRRISGTQN
jgi:hypothetical protein